MSRKVFYSFHYEHDAWRAAQVRNCNTIADEDEYGVIDSVEWEKIKRGGDAAIKRWIQEQLHQTSVTVVLIGAHTAEREWVLHEIEESWKRGNGIVGVRVHGIENQYEQTDLPGRNPLDVVRFADGTALSLVCKTYDWADDGRHNITDWVEEAFQNRARMIDEKELAEREAPDTVSKVTVSTVASPRIITNPPRPWAR